MSNPTHKPSPPRKKGLIRRFLPYFKKYRAVLHLFYWEDMSTAEIAKVTGSTPAAVRKQLPVAVENLVSIMEGRAPEAKYDGYAACPIVTDYGHVLLCEFDYAKEPKITFPFSLFDMSREQWVAWILKVYMLKPVYFQLMLRGLY